MAGTSDTRQRALDAALELFSGKGFEATSMGDIAGALHIKAPSLYKYFKGKDELYGALAPIVEEHYSSLWRAVETRLEQMEHQAVQGGHLTAEQLEQSAAGWFAAELTEPRARHCRRLADRPRWLWSEPLAVFEGCFARLIDQEILRRGDPHVMAVQFLSPLLQLLTLADDQLGAAETEPLQAEAGLHIRQFHRVFAHKEQRGGASSGVTRLFRR